MIQPGQWILFAQNAGTDYLINVKDCGDWLRFSSVLFQTVDGSTTEFYSHMLQLNTAFNATHIGVEEEELSSLKTLFGTA